MERVDMLVKAGCKVLVIDTSHGACSPAKEQITRIRKAYGNTVDIIVGNIASYDSAMYLLKGEHRPDSLKVGIGPGSICTTRQVTGHGVPQLTAVFQVWKAVQDYGNETGFYVPIIADGGIRTSGDIVKCLAAGASSVMLGSVFASCEEAPGEVVLKGGKAYKTIRGMGSRSAMEARSGSRGRYHRQGEDHSAENLTKAQKTKVVPEGVEGLVQLKGTVESVMTELCGGVQSGLAHSGAKGIPDFRLNARLWRQSVAGALEGRPHDLTDIRN
jgi:IMP dehydrogenase